MRKLLTLFVFACGLHAAGTVTSVLAPLGTTQYTLTFSWTGDAANGTVPATAAPSLIANQQLQGYHITQAQFVPGSPAPTNGYSVTLTDANGFDALDGDATFLSSTLTQTVPGGVNSPPINGTLTLNVTGTTVNSAKGTVIVYLAPANYLYGLGCGPNVSNMAQTTGSTNGCAQIFEKGTRNWRNFTIAVGSQATVNVATSATNKIVLDSICYSAAATTAPAATQVNLTVSGSTSGTLFGLPLAVTATTGQLIAPSCIGPGLNIISTTNETVTVAWSAGVANVFEGLSFSFYTVTP